MKQWLEADVWNSAVYTQPINKDVSDSSLGAANLNIGHDLSLLFAPVH